MDHSGNVCGPTGVSVSVQLPIPTAHTKLLPNSCTPTPNAGAPSSYLTTSNWYSVTANSGSPLVVPGIEFSSTHGGRLESVDSKDRKGTK